MKNAVTLFGGQGYLRENPNPYAAHHPTDGGLRYWARPPDEGAGHHPHGIVTIHSTEGLHDTVGPDDGAEAVARHMTRRTTWASYHALVDSDSIVELLPPAWRAAHVARDDSGRLPDWWANSHSYGLSWGGHAGRWGDDPARDDAILDNAAEVIHRYRVWLHDTLGIVMPLQTVSTADIARGALGVTEHGSWQRDRSDPGWTGLNAGVIGYRPSGPAYDRLFELVEQRDTPATKPLPPPIVIPKEDPMHYFGKDTDPAAQNEWIIVWPSGVVAAVHPSRPVNWDRFAGQAATAGDDLVVVPTDEWAALKDRLQAVDI